MCPAEITHYHLSPLVHCELWLWKWGNKVLCEQNNALENIQSMLEVL